MSIQIYSANWVVPIDREPIRYGEVVVEDDIILEVRPQVSGQSNGRDFGNAILMPGLVNAHTHIEYTALRGLLEDVAFFPWIRSLMASKARLSHDDWLWSGRLAALELLAGGTTTIGDNTDAGVSARIAQESGLRATIYEEVFGIDESESVASIIAGLDSKIAANAKYASSRIQFGVSPHAPYTVRPALFTALAEYCSRTGLPTSIHVAETEAEASLIQSGAGPFAEMFQRRGMDWTIPGVSPTQYVFDNLALTPKSLAVHCVHQSPEDIAMTAASGAAIAHCPKSNGKLGAGIAPLSQWLQIPGLRVALGTDSAVSNNGLDLFEEMRFAILTQRAATLRVEHITARQMVRLATLGGAEALGLGDITGSLTPGKRADLIAVSLDEPHSTPTSDPSAALVYTTRASDVRFTMCNGVELYNSGHWPTLDRDAILKEATQVRAKAEIER